MPLLPDVRHWRRVRRAGRRHDGEQLRQRQLLDGLFARDQSLYRRRAGGHWQHSWRHDRRDTAGIIEALGAGYLGELTHGVFGSNYQDVFAFMVLILVLVFRPAGLLGERVAHRA